MIGPAEYPAKLDENRPHKGTSLKNSEHLEQDTSIRFQREKKHRSGGRKDRNKRIGNHNAIQMETSGGMPSISQRKLLPILNSRPNYTIQV